MSIFSENLQQVITSLLSRYETKRSSILPILHAIQDECGWIKPEHINALESEYGLHRVHVKEVVTFYSMYRTKEPKKFRVMVCDNIVCTIMGAKETKAEIKKKIEAYKKEGKDCPFSVEGVPCLGVCDGAPAMLVNKDRYLKVNPEAALDIMKRYDI